MRIISWNINGLGRHFKELTQLAEQYQPDFICLQKVRTKLGREKYELPGYKQSWGMEDCADWSGVMLYWKPSSHSELTLHPDSPIHIPTPELSKDGHLQAYRLKGLNLINAYVPYANPQVEGAIEHRQRFDKEFIKFISELATDNPMIICGDLNIVHSEKDVWNGEYIKTKPDFQEWERDNFNALLSAGNLSDSFRELHPSETKVSYFSNDLYRTMNMGYRIDYFLVSRSLLPFVTNADIIEDFGTSQSYPIILDLDLGVTDKPSRCRKSSQGLDRKASIANASEAASIPVKDAARWMARLAACDGTISPTERKILSEFAKNFGLNSAKLIRLAYGISNDYENEVELIDPNEKKGREFEEFVVSLCSDKSRFKLLAWRGDKISGSTYAAENLLPDLHLRHRLDAAEVEYLVECKYRSSWGEDGIDLSSQYVRYHNAAKDSGLELFIALGVGGTPSNPDEFFLVPGRMVKLDKKIDRDRFIKCVCPQTPDGFHNYINHYFNKRVFKTI